MKFSISNGYIKTGEQRMTAPSTGWKVHTTNAGNLRLNDYYQAMNLGNEIKETVEQMRRIGRGEAPAEATTAAASTSGAAGAVSAAAKAPASTPVKIVCPYCGAPTFPDANNCCEYCGSKLS